MPNLSLKERIEAKIIPEPNSGCFLWTGKLDVRGYARIWHNRGDHIAHRLYYELKKGPIPEGLVLDHLCRVRCCVNPDHLEPVTNRENCYIHGIWKVKTH